MPDEDDPGSDEDVEIEILEDEPAFLRGQTKLSMHLSPIKIVKVSESAPENQCKQKERSGTSVHVHVCNKFTCYQAYIKVPPTHTHVHVCIHGLWHTLLQNPDGSLQRAALTQSALSKERRELRAAQREADMDNVPRDIGKTWIDPVPGGTGTGGTVHALVHLESKTW